MNRKRTRRHRHGVLVLWAALALGILLPCAGCAQTTAGAKAKVAVTATPDLVTAENAYLRIEFMRKDGGIRLARLVNTANKRTILADAGPLWRVEGPRGTIAGDAPARAASLAARKLPGGGARLTLRWEGCGAGVLDVEVTVDVSPGSRETLWRIHPTSTTGDQAPINMVRFPAFDGIGRGGKWDRLVRPIDKPLTLNPEILQPTGWGDKLPYWGGGLFCMQFVIYEFAAADCTERREDDQAHGGGGLYLAAYDPTRQLKDFFSKGLGAGKGTSLAIGHYYGPWLAKEQNGKPGLGFPCAVGVFDGGYWGGLDLYRDWVRGQAWCAAGPIRKRTDFPRKLLSVQYANPMSFDPPTSVLARFKGKYDRFEDLHFEEFTDAEKASLVPLALANAKRYTETLSNPDTPRFLLHWYRWHIQPFDYAYPDYFPIRPGWLEARAQIDKAYPDYFVHMPYINGISVCEHSELWTKRKAEMDRWSTGNKQRWGVSDFANMCPDTEFWQETMTKLARRIFQETQCDGLYLDQLGVYQAFSGRCMKTDHGHKPGDPASLTRGYQTMLRKIRAAVKPINPEAFFTQEFFTEAQVGSVDGFLTLGHSDLGLIGYVYGEYVVLFGHGGLWPVGVKDDYNIRRFASSANEFLSGAQLGWGLDRLEVAYCKRLVRMRVKALPYLRLPMARPITETTSLRKGDHGEAVVIATHPCYPVGQQLPANILAKCPERFLPKPLHETYELDCKAAGLQPGRYRFRVITETGDKELEPLEVTGATVTFPITLGPQESAIYLLEPLAARGK